MGASATSLDDESLAPYRAYWRKRRERDAAAVREREAAARKAVREAAALLRARYGATDVRLFGSLARGRFRKDSDIDLAVWGLRPEDLFRAWADIEAFAPGIEFDLVPVEEARPHIAEDIARTSVPVDD